MIAVYYANRNEKCKVGLVQVDELFGVQAHQHYDGGGFRNAHELQRGPARVLVVVTYVHLEN